MSGFAIVPLRLFLGMTFLYASFQKINDPGFLRVGSRTYIGTQMQAFSHGSPIQGLIHHLIPYAAAVGVLIVMTEGCIGVLILVGLLTRPAALVGLALSFGFFLSASWQTYPYFFGSDIVFVVCWLTLAITGPGVYALDVTLEAPLRRAVTERWSGPMHGLLFSLLTGWQHRSSEFDSLIGAKQTSNPQSSGMFETRRRFTRAEALAGYVVTLGLIALGLYPRSSTIGRLSSGSALPKGQPTAGATTTRVPPGNPAVPAGARKIGNISQLPLNSAGTVTDPKTGVPAIIVHTQGSSFYAFDAVCTHAGCTVQFDPQQRLLVCPCHGGAFDPAHGAQVVAGPPPTPLGHIDMKIDSAGNIYIV